MLNTDAVRPVHGLPPRGRNSDLAAPTDARRARVSVAARHVRTMPSDHRDWESTLPMKQPEYFPRTCRDIVVCRFSLTSQNDFCIINLSSSHYTRRVGMLRNGNLGGSVLQPKGAYALKDVARHGRHSDSTRACRSDGDGRQHYLLSPPVVFSSSSVRPVSSRGGDSTSP